VQQVFSVRFHDQHTQLLASGGWDKVVHLWDLRLGHSVGSFSGPFVAGDCVDLHGHELLAASNGHAEQVQIFDLRRPGGAPVLALTIGTGDGADAPFTVYACRFSRDAARSLIGVGGGVPGGGDGAVKVYDRSRGAFVASVQLSRQSVYSLDFSPASSGPIRLAFAAGSKVDSFVQLMDAVPPLPAEDGGGGAALAAAAS
jgi:WD40 repeat protein